VNTRCKSYNSLLKNISKSASPVDDLIPQGSTMTYGSNKAPAASPQRVVEDSFGGMNATKNLFSADYTFNDFRPSEKEKQREKLRNTTPGFYTGSSKVQSSSNNREFDVGSRDSYSENNDDMSELFSDEELNNGNTRRRYSFSREGSNSRDALSSRAGLSSRGTTSTGRKQKQM
jgi:hypothetical protein